MRNKRTLIWEMKTKLEGIKEQINTINYVLRKTKGVKEEIFKNKKEIKRVQEKVTVTGKEDPTRV